MTDYPLYDGTPPHEEPETSEEAAFRMLPFVGTQRERVKQFVALRAARGATDYEIERGLRLKHQTASPRRRELVLLGELVPLGVKRRTQGKFRAMVHVLPEFGPPPSSGDDATQGALFG